MVIEWPEEKVIDLQRRGVLLVEDGNHGEYRPRRDEFTTEGVSFIRAADMDAGRVLFESASRINDAARQRIRKGIGRGGDILLSHKGTVGKVAAVSKDAPPFVCSPQTTFWRVLDPCTLDANYLYAYLRSHHFHVQLRGRQDETDMAAYVSLTAQRELVIPLPPIEVQRQIGTILCSLDDKIELNRRMSQTLENIAAVMFKSWFIDFDPVHAKAEGQDPNLPPEIADLFPDTFEDSELGPIPKGWDVCPVGEVVRCVGGATPSTKNPEFWEGGTHPFITPKDMSSLQSPIILDSERHITDAGVRRISSKQLPVGTVILSSRAPIGYLGVVTVPVSVNQGVIAMICDGDLPNLYMLHWASTNMDLIKSRAGGTTFAEISKKNFRPIAVLVPPDTVLSAFVDCVSPLYERITLNVTQNRRLGALRDLLLPKLMSGQLKIPIELGNEEVA